MVDFKKLRNSKQKSLPIDPVEIFRRLPKTSEIADLYSSQAQVLNDWFQRRSQRDVVLKLHTGGGKTLVGLLIAQSVINEKKEPVIYLAPTVQLVRQTIEKANEYGIPVTEYVKGQDFDDEFLTSKSVLVCTYQALFNGKSRFGAPGSSRDILKVASIILDDAHVSLTSIRESFTLVISRNEDAEDYEYLAGIFRDDFRKLGKLGTYDDVVSGGDANILEVPYWSWKSNSTQISEYLRKRKNNNIFVWPLIRDAIDYSHCLISKKSIVVTPILPLVDLIPTFENCKSRIYMSATIADDSSIVRTFNASKDSISKPITSRSLAGVSERLILCPELMEFESGDVQDTVKSIVKWASKHVGTVVLVPSGAAASLWGDVAIPVDTEEVESKVRELQEKSTKGPFVFANRYDGIDLPGDACRVLIMAGLPKGTGEYEIFRSNVFQSGEAINSSLSQRIEQGIGRAARGPGDYCVVIITGKDLISWISRTSNVKYLTSSTRAQLEIGLEVSKDVSSMKELAEAMLSSINRDKDWIEFHAEALADSVDNQLVDQNLLDSAEIERKALKLWRDGYFEKAVRILRKYCNNDIDKEMKAWLYQLGARIALYWGKNDLSQELQELAFSHNRYLLRPQTAPVYKPIYIETAQSEKIVATVSEFSPRKGLLSKFEDIASRLVSETTSNQFEESLKDLGELLGFVAERPEKLYGGDGGAPDVIWLLNNKEALVIEVKSKKYQKNPLTKDELGQLLSSSEWFKKQYTNYSFLSVSLHPNKYATKNTTIDNVYVFTLDSLNVMVAKCRLLFERLCESEETDNQINILCTALIEEYGLTQKHLKNKYLCKFEHESS